MILVAVGMFIAYIVTFLLMPFIIRVARVNKLYDKPDERKTHTYPVSSLGGVGMIAGLSISILLVTDFTVGDSAFQYYLASFFIIFMLGVIDDLFVLHPLKKLAGQLLVALIITAKAHLLITNLQGLGGFYELSTVASYLLTFFAILLIINSFNLIDGVDGLAGSLGLASSFFFGLFFYIKGDIPYAILGFTMSGTLMAFLVFNFPPARIFMGDSGSMLIGLVNAILAIRLIEDGNITTGLTIYSPLAFGFSILLIPMLDVLRVFIIRLTKGASPFAPDRNHVHHLLLNRGFNHTQVTISMLLASIFFSVVGYFINYLNINLVAAILTLFYFSGVFVIRFVTTFNPLRVVREKDAINSGDAKVLMLYGDETEATNTKAKKSAPAETVNINSPKTKAE
jgi:UDP-N-acetylmuramyl pentapeptide phosphotransferase/UDP-N-acetylglucosamine-1-phosphate transferase